MLPFFGSEIVCGVAGESREGRAEAVRRLTCASSFVRCLRRSSSLSFMDSASSTKASGVGGRELGGGLFSTCRAASGEDECRIELRLHAKSAKPALNKKGTPIYG